MQSHAEPCTATHPPSHAVPCSAMQSHAEPRRAPPSPAAALPTSPGSPHLLAALSPPPALTAPRLMPTSFPASPPSPPRPHHGSPDPAGQWPFAALLLWPFFAFAPSALLQRGGQIPALLPAHPPAPLLLLRGFPAPFCVGSRGGERGGWLKIHRVSPDPSCCVAMGLRAQCRAAPAASVGSAHWGWGDGGPMGVPPALNAWRCHHGEAGAAGGGKQPRNVSVPFQMEQMAILSPIRGPPPSAPSMSSIHEPHL